MELHEIENAVKTGVCPFTQKAYDCGKCDHNPSKISPHGPMSLHFGLCITRPLHYGTKGWRDTLKYFERRDRDEAQKILSRLLQMGVEQIPVGSCDLDHFCFKHGCVGHTIENTKGRRRGVRAGAKKRCEVCGAAFGPLSTRKRFCSQKCHDRYYAAKRRPKATCEQCGRRFQPLENTPGRFCSHKCYHDWQHEHGEGGRIDRKLAQVSARAQFLARRDLEAKAVGGVPVRVSQSRTGLRIESRGNCAGGCATNIPHT